MPTYGAGIIATSTNSICTIQATSGCTTIFNTNPAGPAGFVGGGGNGGTACGIAYINTSLTGGSGDGSTWSSTCITNPYLLPVEWVIDEDYYMNNIEYFELARQRGVVFRIRTAEEKRLAEEAAEIARLERVRLEQERKIACERARDLLINHLTQEQRNTLIKNKWFVVTGGKTKTQYRIRTDYGISGNIEILDKNNRMTATLCCHCSDHYIPDSDQFLAQAIALKYDEEGFLKIANRRAA